MIRWALLAGMLVGTLFAASPVPRESRQLLLVVSPGWKADYGRLYRFERVGAKWRRVGRVVAVNLGKNGLGWGRGLHGYRLDTGPVKREGDGRAPAGVFELPFLFGEGKETFRYPYRQMTRHHHCIDDINSRYYNRIIDSRHVERDYRSHEKMRFPAGLYRYGIVVEHNPKKIPGAGSCIFLHIRHADGRPTVGCTAMNRKPLVELMRWLDPRKHPVLIQAPRNILPKLLPDNLQLTQLR